MQLQIRDLKDYLALIRDDLVLFPNENAVNAANYSGHYITLEKVANGFMKTMNQKETVDGKTTNLPT